MQLVSYPYFITDCLFIFSEVFCLFLGLYWFEIDIGDKDYEIVSVSVCVRLCVCVCVCGVCVCVYVCFRDEHNDILAVADWGQKLSFYQLSGKQVCVCVCVICFYYAVTIQIIMSNSCQREI